MSIHVEPPLLRPKTWEELNRELPVSWHLMAWREYERWERYPAIEALMTRKKRA